MTRLFPLAYAGTLVLALPLLIAAPASAATLVNSDGEDYSFQIVDEDGTIEYVIEAGQTLDEVCETKCKLIIEGVGEVDAIKGDTVVIREKKIEKRS